MPTLTLPPYSKHHKPYSGGVTLDGDIIRWDSNGLVPPDLCPRCTIDCKPITSAQLIASIAARESESAAFLAEYRRANSGPVTDPEQLFEMRAAFGPGAKVVDAITGVVTQL